MSVIEVKNLTKKYKIGERQQYVAFRDVLSRALSPASWFSKQKKSDTRDFYALKDVSFSLEQGDVLGIVGKNGAGKSTLLKILSQITPPTEGEVRLRGKVGSLLEVGTGFHPELTGRENIFLNGAILGMRKREIEKKFDDIVEFSGVSAFLDTPVKRYSSGMYVRLAFSVAAHLDPDILIVDEVLAVGDSEFQKKCLGKMQDVTQKEGRTVIFVSHNMSAVKSLCNRCVLLSGGEVQMIDTPDKVINTYLSSDYNPTATITERQHIRGDKSAVIDRISVAGGDGQFASTTLLVGEPLTFTIDYTVHKTTRPISFFIIFYDTEGRPIVSSFQKDVEVFSPVSGQQTMKVVYQNADLLPGKYVISAGIFYHDRLEQFDFADWVEFALMIDVGNSFYRGGAFDHRLGIVNKDAVWLHG